MYKDSVVEYEHLEVFNVLKEIGVYISNGEELSIKDLFNGSFPRSYALKDDYNKKEIILVPTPHSKRLVQLMDFSIPNADIYNRFLILKQSAVDRIDNMKDQSNAMTSLVGRNFDSYIELYNEPVRCKIYDVYNFLARCGNKFKLLLNKTGEIPVITLLTKYQIKEDFNIEDKINRDLRLSMKEKEVILKNCNFEKLNLS